MSSEGSAVSQDFGAEDEVRVYWRPGCSSCAKVKDYLASRDVPFTSIDVVAEPDGLSFLKELGIRSVPVVMRGGEFSFAQSLDDVAAFLGLSAQASIRLPPQVLIDRWSYFQRALRGLVELVPDTGWSHAPRAGLTLLGLSYHVCRIPVGFLACVQDGVRDWVEVAMAPPPPGTDRQDLIALSHDVEARIAAWWRGVEDRSCSWIIAKYDGSHSAHVFLERQVWHGAHHTRQITDALAELGVDVDGLIDPMQYEGLPMPARIW